MRLFVAIVVAVCDLVHDVDTIQGLTKYGSHFRNLSKSDAQKLLKFAVSQVELVSI